MPLFYQPEPHGRADSEAYDALLAAGYDLTFRHMQRGPVHVRYIWASRGAYRTRRHFTLRAAWAQAQSDHAPSAGIGVLS